MTTLIERIRSGEILVADGAMGTSLFGTGVRPGESLERYNLDDPARVEAVSAAFVEAGADVVQTNTFGASPLNLARHGLEDRADEINGAAVRIAKSAARGRAFVYASIGPCGRLVKPYGDTEPERIAESFRRQLDAIAAEGVDLVCVETMTDLTEAKLAVEAARAAAPNTPIAATMTFDPTPRGFFTVMGTDIERAARELIDAGADLVGSNCGNGTETMVRIAGEFRRCTEAPLVIQSNAGVPEMKAGEPVWPESPSDFAAQAAGLADVGVAIIGGCCGTTPEHIRFLRAAVDAVEKA